MSSLEFGAGAVCFSSLILVNGKNPFYELLEERELMPVQSQKNDIFLRYDAAESLNRLMAEIQGWKEIVPVSGWRSKIEQQQIWDDSITQNGEVFTRKYVALPGHSEHETGLAIDLGLQQENVDFIRPSFPYSGICRIFREKAAMYGFIERYPEGKEHITGISHEPWHFRYVGRPHAQIIAGLGITLEEYHARMGDQHEC